MTTEQERRRTLAIRIGIAALVPVALVSVAGLLLGRPTGPEPSPPPGGARVGLATFHEDGIQFTYPTAWSTYRVQTMSTGFGSIYEILGSHPVPPQCRNAPDDINCFYQAPLEPGTVSVQLGSLSLMTGTIFEFPQPDPASRAVITRGVAGGLPAVLIDRGDLGPDDFYHADLSLQWVIARPDSVSSATTIEASIRGPGVGQMRAELEALVGSLQFDDVPKPIPTDPAERAAAGRAAAAAGIAAFGGQGGADLTLGPDDLSVYDCFVAAIDHPKSMAITAGPGAMLGGSVETACEVRIEVAGSVFWKVSMTAVAGVGSSQPGASYREILWLTSLGAWAGSSSEGFLPAARLPAGPLDAAAARRAATAVLTGHSTDSDFYACFPSEPGTSRPGTVTTGPNGITKYHDVAVTCGTKVEAAEDRTSYVVTLTASWPAAADHPAGSLTAAFHVGADGSSGDPEIRGDPLP